MRPWFKAYTGIFSDIKYLSVARLSGHAVSEVIAVWLALLDRACESEIPGCARGIDTDSIDVFLQVEPGSTDEIIDAMIKKGLLTEDLTVASWNKLQKVKSKTQTDTGDGPLSNAERQRRYREKHKQQEGNDVTDSSNGSNGVTKNGNGNNGVTQDNNGSNSVTQDSNGSNGVTKENNSLLSLRNENNGSNGSVTESNGEVTLRNGSNGSVTESNDIDKNRIEEMRGEEIKDNPPLTPQGEREGGVTGNNTGNDEAQQQEQCDTPQKRKRAPRRPRDTKPRGELGNVMLTDAEYDRLCKDYGKEKSDKAIAYLDTYIPEKGYQTKDHNLTIRRWVMDAVDEQSARQQKIVKVIQGQGQPIPTTEHQYRAQSVRLQAQALLNLKSQGVSFDGLDDAIIGEPVPDQLLLPSPC